MTIDDWIDIGAELPLDGLEIYWPAVREETSEGFARIRERAAKHDVALPMMCASPDFTQTSRAAFEREIEDEAAAIRGTAALGGSFTRILSGQRRPDIGRTAGIDLVVEAIHRLLPVAREHKVTLVMENHVRDYFWELNEFAQDSATFLEIVGSIDGGEPFGVQFDASNAVVSGEDPIELLEAVQGRVVTAAASDRYLAAGPDGVRRVVHAVVGDGVLDYERICSILADAGFAGWISIEDGDDPAAGPADIARSAEYIRGVMNRHGIA